MNTNATATHGTECICVACCEADLIAHIRKTRSTEDADRLLTELGTMPSKTVGERTRFKTPGQRSGRGIVRKISERQARYIAFLLKSRDFTSLINKPWFTTDVDNISLAGARTFIDALLGCPELPKGDVPADLATDKQVAFIVSLLAQRDTTGTPYEGKTEDDAKKVTKGQAKTIINNLLALPYPTVEVTKESVAAIAGIYELEIDGELCIFRMKKARGGKHFYAMKLDRTAGDAWNYAEGMSRKVPSEGRKLTLEECEALSLALGGCCMCGATLTATVNGVGPGARFIGPICAGNMGF